MTVADPDSDVLNEFYLEHYMLAVLNIYLGMTKGKFKECQLTEGHYCSVDKLLVAQNAEPSGLMALFRRDICQASKY